MIFIEQATSAIFSLNSQTNKEGWRAKLLKCWDNKNENKDISLTVNNKFAIFWLLKIRFNFGGESARMVSILQDLENPFEPILIVLNLVGTKYKLGKSKMVSIKSSKGF